MAETPPKLAVPRPEESAPLAEAETAVRTTSATLAQAASGMGNFSLCHGDGGNADLLVMAADVLDRPELRQIAQNAALRALDRFEAGRLPWPCGVMNAGESPNLMLGLAGIAYYFLRLYDSTEIPTVLLPAAAAAGTTKARRMTKRRASASR